MDWESKQDLIEIRATNWLSQHGHGKDLLCLTTSLIKKFGLSIHTAALLAREWVLCQR